MQLQAGRGKEGTLSPSVPTQGGANPGELLPSPLCVPCQTGGVTGCEALVAPLAVGSQLLAHVPSWPVLGGERSFLEGKMRLLRPHFAVLTCSKYGFASACPQCGLQGGCEDGGPSLVREWSTQTPVAPSALPQTRPPWKHCSSPFSSTLTLCCYCSVQRSPHCCETPTSQHRRSPLCPVGRGFHHHLPDLPSIPTLTSSNTRVCAPNTIPRLSLLFSPSAFHTTGSVTHLQP